MRVRKLKRRETSALMPRRGSCSPGAFTVGAMVVVIAVMMILATTPGLAGIVEGWGEAELIETVSGPAFLPQVAMDGDGNAVAVWLQWDGTRYSIWSNRYVVGEGWGGAELIATDDEWAEPPQMAMNEDGNAVAVWSQFDGTRWNIWSNGYVVGVGWGDAELIEINDGRAYAPQVAIDRNGNVVAVWGQFDGTRWNIWSNRYVVGEGWGDAEPIEFGDGDAWFPQVVIDRDGDAVAVWFQFEGTRTHVWSNRYVVGEGWGDTELIESSDRPAEYPQVAMDEDGNAVAVWHQFDGTRWNIWSNRYAIGVGWGDAELVEVGDGTAEYPQVAMNNDGNAVAVWHQFDDIEFSIWSNRYVVGEGWGDAELLETSDGSVYDPQVAIDVGGNAVVVWWQFDGTRDGIWSNRYVVGEGWGDAQLVETNDGDAHSPQVVVGGDGNAIAVWEQWDGVNWSIWSNRYTSLDTHHQHRHCVGTTDAAAIL